MRVVEPTDISFDTVVCGIDGSSESREAVRQAVLIGGKNARYHAVSAWDPSWAYRAGPDAARWLEKLRSESESALSEAEGDLPGLVPLLVRGPIVASLLNAVTDLRADLMAVGSHGHSRAAGILFGSVATAMTRHAPCPVLVAREAPAPPLPGLILHAADGSPESMMAARVAGQLAARHEVDVVTMHVGEAGERSRELAEEAATIIEASGREPIPRTADGSPRRRIVEAANELGAGIVVIGSRGRTGVAALGSVSEQVVHHASCSVLVVRTPSHPEAEHI